MVIGKPVEGPGPDRSMVFQDYTSFDNRTVRDNIAFGLECRGVPRASGGAGARVDRQGRPRRQARRDEVSAPAVGRHAPARRDRAHADPDAAHHSDGRAVRRARPDDAAEHAGPAGRVCGAKRRPRCSSSPIRSTRRSISAIASTSSRRRPGTIIQEMEVPPPDRPPKEMQREPDSSIACARSATSWRTWRRRREPATDVATPTPPPSEERAARSGHGGLSEGSVSLSMESAVLSRRRGRGGAEPWPELLPLVAAGELAYLAGLVSMPRFRAAIDAQVHAAGKTPSAAGSRGAAAASLVTMLTGLPPDARDALSSTARALPGDARHRRGVRGAAGDQVAAPRRSARPRSTACSGCSCGCCCRRRRSIASCSR